MSTEDATTPSSQHGRAMASGSARVDAAGLSALIRPGARVLTRSAIDWRGSNNAEKRARLPREQAFTIRKWLRNQKPACIHRDDVHAFAHTEQRVRARPGIPWPVFAPPADGSL